MWDARSGMPKAQNVIDGLRSNGQALSVCFVDIGKHVLHGGAVHPRGEPPIM